jgi:hypothetical protein
VLRHSVVFNFLVIESCELLQFPGGSLGLFKYSGHEAGQECAKYSGEVEDPAMKYAQMWSRLALAFGCFFLVLVVVLQQRVHHVPYFLDAILLNFLSIGVQLSMAHVYIAWKNDICETYGCGWGRGLVYNVVAQALYLIASVFVVFQRGGIVSLPGTVERRSLLDVMAKMSAIEESESSEVPELTAELSCPNKSTQLRERKTGGDSHTLRAI